MKIYGGPSDQRSGWTKCPLCHEDLKSVNLQFHLEKVHHQNISKKRMKLKILLPLIILLTIAMIVTAAVVFYIDTNVETDDEGDDIVEPTNGWLDTYTPKQSVGFSDKDWWIYYPTQNPSSGEVIDHPSWLVDMLINGPVLIFCHSTNCIPCIEQQGSIDTVMGDFKGDIQLVDLLSGVDEEANELITLYDANGPSNYIPTTIILTLVQNSIGNTVIGWHSIEGATGDAWLTFHIMDAIYYHHENVDEWS